MRARSRPLVSAVASRALRRDRRAALLLAASVAAVAAHAAAQTPAPSGPPAVPSSAPRAASTMPASAGRPITLRWRAPASCPDEAALSARIERLLGAPPATSDRRLDAAGVVEATAQGFRLELTLSSGASETESTRVLQGASCDALTDAGALVIALAFDPDAVAAQELKRAEADAPDAAAAPDAAETPEPSAPDVAPAPTELIRIPVPLPAPVSPPPAAAPGSRLAFSVLAAVLGDTGTLTDAAAGFRAGLSLGIDAWRVTAAFEGFPAARRALPARPGVGVEMRLFAFALEGCRRVLPFSRADPPPSGIAGSELSACLGFELGEIHGAGFGVASPGSAGVLWAAPRADLRADLVLASWVALTADVGLVVPLDRRPFVLDLAGARTVVHEPSPVAGRAALGAALRF